MTGSRLALRAVGALRAFNAAGVLAPADVHVACRLAALAGEPDEDVRLAVALAVRAPRLGHVYVDLATIRDTAAVDAEAPVDLAALPWPDPDAWVARVAASPLVAAPGPAGADPGPADPAPSPAAARPARLEGAALYLDRYWREERDLAAALRELIARPPVAVDEARLADGLARLFPGAGDERQRLAAETAVRRRFAVVAGGPGTGKTTTVARILALLLEQAAGGREPQIALAAPTGKAQARLIEAVREEAARLDVAPAVGARLLALDAATLHRLLGRRPDSHSRFRHHRGNRLPHDVVIVDETSMVSLERMARLVEAVRADGRLVLVGDPAQLRSIEAGAVLGDITAAGPRDGIVVLERVHRYGGAIARVAEAIRSGDGDAVVAALAGVTWIAADAAEPAALAPVRERATAWGRAIAAAARAGAARAALDALGDFRLLCAHRRGPYGVSAWTARIEGWLGEPGAAGSWYVGRPLLVTENDHELRLYNGDTGVVVADADAEGAVSAAFERGGEIARLGPNRLEAVETVYAMTVHKSQGSQFGTAAVVLPDAASPLATRELLYTAVTRARRELIVVGTEASVRAAVARPVARASGLAARLWGADAARPR